MHSSRMRTVRNSSRLLGGGDGRSHQKAIPEDHTRRPYQKAMTFWLKGVSVRRDPPSTRRPYQRAIPEGHNRRPHQKAITEDQFQPKDHACWDTACNACWDSTPRPPVYRITDTSKNITLATTSLRPVMR